MKKILVCDYDGTLKTNEIIENIKYVNLFMKNNIFVISTGRPFDHMKLEIEKYNIKYDYLTCHDGSLIFNKYNNLIYADTIKSNDFKEISDKINNLKFIKEQIIWSTYGVANNYDINNNKIIEVELRKLYDSKEDYLKLKEYFNFLSVYDLFGSIFIKNTTNKSDGIKKLLEIENLKNYEIYTIGDSLNDLEMLKDFNGYKMLNCSNDLKNENINTIRQVNTLIKKLI